MPVKTGQAKRPTSKRAPRKSRPNKLNPRSNDTVARLAIVARLGATDDEIAQFLGVCRRTLHTWKHTYPKIRLAMQAGKDEANERVKRSLYQRAVGFTHPTVKLFKHVDKTTGSAEIIAHEVEEYYPPDTTAGIWWLKNRDPANWKDRHVHVGDDTQPAIQVEGSTRSPRELARMIAFALAKGQREKQGGENP